MKRPAFAGFGLLLAFAECAAAQIVPVSTCHAALPCSIPYGLRPADSVRNLANGNGGPGNTALSVGLNDRMNARLVRPMSEDPSEFAARIFVRKNPPLARPTPAPTPASPRAP